MSSWWQKHIHRRWKRKSFVRSLKAVGVVIPRRILKTLQTGNVFISTGLKPGANEMIFVNEKCILRTRHHFNQSKSDYD
jgi:hypothetical protein